jgi:hypothetical protein
VVNDSKLDCPYANLRIVDKGSSSPTFICGTVITKWGLNVNPIRLTVMKLMLTDISEKMEEFSKEIR